MIKLHQGANVNMLCWLCLFCVKLKANIKFILFVQAFGCTTLNNGLKYRSATTSYLS